jgi:phasin family protein
MTKTKQTSASMFGKNFDAFGDLGKVAQANIDALNASKDAVAAGVKQLSSDVVEQGRKQIEENKAALSALMGVRNPTDLFKLQYDLAQKQFNRFSQDAAHFGQSLQRTGEQAINPLKERLASLMQQAN